MSVDAAELRHEIAAVFGEVTAARRLVSTGRIVELIGLDSRVAALCAAVEALPRAEGLDLAPLLESLRSSLDQLAGAVTMAAQPPEERRQP